MRTGSNVGENKNSIRWC